MSVLTKIDEISSNPKARKSWFALVCLVFVSMIILPSLFVLTGAITEWDAVTETLGDPTMMAILWESVFNSFSISLIVTILDIIVGLPMAWIMVRKQFRGKKYLDTLIDMPLAFPTASVGIAVVMFWGAPEGMAIPGLGLVISPFLMIILLHTVFTYPYMVRSLSAILEQIDPNFEIAGMTLGAPKFTAIRTITLPLFRAGLTTGFILCFARSLSETGGTYMALQLVGAITSDTILPTWLTGPTFISWIKHNPEMDPTGPLIIVSIILIILALLILILAKFMMNNIKMPWSKVWPRFERKLSKKIAIHARDIFTYGFFLIVALIPAFYIFAYLFAPAEALNLNGLLGSIGTSFLVAGISVIFGLIFGIPMALYISRKGNTRLGKILDNAVNIPLIVPTTVLGVSLAMFWGSFGLSEDWGLLLVIFGHISFTYPLMVRNISAAIDEVDPSYVEIARTLGAKPFKSFSKILMPIIKPSIFAGAILAFTRSLGETGATIAISESVVTVPVYIMDLMKSEMFYQGAIAAIVLVIICFVLMFSMRYITTRRSDDA